MNGNVSFLTGTRSLSLASYPTLTIHVACQLTIANDAYLLLKTIKLDRSLKSDTIFALHHLRDKCVSTV